MRAEGEDPTSFFNHDPDAEEDAPPVASPERYASPTRNGPNRPASPLTVVSPISASGRPTPSTAYLTSPRATGSLCRPEFEVGTPSGGDAFAKVLVGKQG